MGIGNVHKNPAPATLEPEALGVTIQADLGDLSVVLVIDDG
jgi:hypothetical protein